MEVFVYRWGMVHSNPDAAIQRDGLAASELRKSAPDWVSCPQCGAGMKRSVLVKHLQRVHEPHQSLPRLTPPGTAPDSKSGVVPALREAWTRASHIEPTTKNRPVTMCDRCGATVRTDRLEGHKQRVHWVAAMMSPPSHTQSPREDHSGAAPALRRIAAADGDVQLRRMPRTIRNTAATQSRLRLKETTERARALLHTPGIGARLQTIPTSALPAAPPTRSRATLKLPMRPRPPLMTCQKCQLFKTSSRWNMSIHMPRCAPKRKALPIAPSKSSPRGLATCGTCGVDVKQDRLARHTSKVHGAHFTDDKAKSRPLIVNEAPSIEDRPDVVNDVSAQGRRHYLDASPDGRYFRDHGRFGSLPSYDGYGDEDSS